MFQAAGGASVRAPAQSAAKKAHERRKRKSRPEAALVDQERGTMPRHEISAS